MTKPVKSFSQQELAQCINEAGLPSFRAQQVLSWLYVKGVGSYDQMTNIPKAVREQFKEQYPLYAPKTIDKQISSDGTNKYLIRLYDDSLMETVGLPSSDGRLTACVSSQSGCAMACEFCATGKLGLTRDLQPGEIVDQVATVQSDYGRRVTNVVVMGQGEPFANYDATLAALRIMNAPKLLNIGARHITVSTCGIFKGIERFSHEPEQFTLAISLHAARQKVRNLLMPAMKNQELNDLRNYLISYTEATNRRFSIEYALMKGINDNAEDLEALIDFCRGLLCHVNLIPLNAVENSRYRPVSQATMTYWQTQLENAGIAATIRASRGSDIAAACGQLARKASKAQGNN